jgi:aspartate/methionine/tyrosine aminotransferase
MSNQAELPKGSLISFMSNKVKANGGINLAQGIPAFDPPQELLNILHQLSFDNLHQYAPGRGNKMLLEQLSKHYKIQESQFLMVNGATEAISLLLIYLQSIIDDSFSVLAFDPVYESYKNLARIFKRPFIAFSQTPIVDFEALEIEILAKNVRVIMVASPGNPLGRIWLKSEFDSLMALANKHKVYVIFDAVYTHLYFDESPFSPLNNLNEQLFYVNAFSKQFSITGWRLGYLIAHQKHIDAIADVHDYTGLCAPSILQQAMASYLDKYNFGITYTDEIRDKLKGNYMQLSQALTDLGFEVYKAQGGYFVWAKLPEAFTNGFEFAIDLYDKQKVATIPGIHFSNNADNYIRFNIARHPYEISMAIGKIKDFIKQKEL